MPTKVLRLTEGLLFFIPKPSTVVDEEIARVEATKVGVPSIETCFNAESLNVVASLLIGIKLSVEFMVVPPNKSLAADADPLKAATEALIVWSVVVKEALKLEIGRVDDPLIFVTNRFLASDADPLIAPNTFLASDADPLKAATELLIVTSVMVNEPLKRLNDPLTCEANRFLASDADPLIPADAAINSLASEAEPLKAATEALIA